MMKHYNNIFIRLSFVLVAIGSLSESILAQNEDKALTPDTISFQSLEFTDTISHQELSSDNKEVQHFPWKQFILPAAMVGIGTLPLYINTVNRWDKDLQHSMKAIILFTLMTMLSMLLWWQFTD